MGFLAAVVILVGLYRLEALTHDEAGVWDFVITTAGHGPLNEGSLVALTSGDRIVSSDAGASTPGSSCYVACRALWDGSLLWRRNVCSSASDRTFNVVFEPSNERLFSVDTSSVVRAWSAVDGSLLWEQQLPPEVDWKLLRLDDGKILQIASSSKVQTIDADNGALVSQRGGSLPIQKRSTKKSLECQGRPFTFDSSQTKFIWSSSTSPLDLGLSSKDYAVDMHMLSCNADGSTAVLVLSDRGVSIAISCSTNQCATNWMAHEGLSSVSQAILLDRSHKLKQNQALNLLNFRNRLASQWKRLKSMSTFATSGANDHLFGFIKSAVLLSQKSHAVYGLTTVGEERSKISFVVNLPNQPGSEHVMVHGAPNSPTGAHGIQGGTLSKQILVVSHGANRLDWICLDGTTGETSFRGDGLELSSPVSQILPMTSSGLTGVCQQSALVVLEDGSLVAIPEVEPVRESIDKLLTSTLNGFYTHKIDKARAIVETYSVPGLNSKVVPTGVASFPHERIIEVAYPIRDEKISSPTFAAGDDSLLIKYINPHLMVVLTMRDDGESVIRTDNSKISRALEARTSEATGKQIRKPLGVTTENDSAGQTASNEPNLFVNLVDTVSGRVLHRLGHANAMFQPRPVVAISENWIFYTYSYAKTRRAELGVLTLFEGMIDSKGLSVVSAPEDRGIFSSLDAREARPLVLSKVYSVAQPFTALGMTKTQKGISNHRILGASVDGHLYNIERKTLDPRRPVGELKDFEKREGLMQYSEFVPLVSYMSLSYNMTIEQVRSIISAPTDLESQTLVLAFGGPDIFFTRTSPSRGFDLLPESFSRTLLSIIVVGLVAVLFAVKRRVSSRMKLAGWK